MNEETKKFMKMAGTLLIAGFIGGIAGGCLSCCMHKCKCHHHDMMPPAPFMFDMMREHHRIHDFDAKMQEKIMKRIDEFKKDFKNGKGKSEFIEEDYIVIPRSFLDEQGKKKNVEPFNGPKPDNKK